MPVLESLKHAPRWAWWTVSGVALGAVAIKVYNDRAKPPDGPADPASVTGEPATVAGSAPGAGVIVPPVIIPAQNDNGNVAAPAPTPEDIYGPIYGPVLGMIPALIDQAASGGGPPPPANTIINVPAPPPAPAKPKPAPAPPKGGNGCPPTFPLKNSQTGKCYKTCSETHCKSHKKTVEHKHCYRDGHEVHVSNEAKGKC